MRTLALCLALAACSDLHAVTECSDDMSQSVTSSFKGLILQPNVLGDVPDGALEVAENVVVSREGIVEPRRGTEEIATKAITKLSAFKGDLVGHGGSTLSHSTDGVTWSDYSGAVSAQSDVPLRTAEAVGNLYLTAAEGVKRLDALTGTPEAAGVPGGLDVEASQGATGTAVPNNTSVAYRVLFGKKDANGRLLLGAPSGRGVYTNTSGATKDGTVTFSLPRGLDSSHFFQVYRSRASVDQNTDPGDELGLVLEGSIPQAKSITQLARTSNVVTASTSTAHGYSVGQIVRVSPGGSVAGAGFAIVAVGSSSKCATSPDGVTWTSRTIPAGDYESVARGGSVFAAVGTNVAATSPDGVTWTNRTIPAGTYHAVTWSGSIFVAVGDSKCATSPDGITWTARTIPTSRSWYSVVWTGSKFVAVGTGYTLGNYAATSSDGITWAENSIGAGNWLYSAAWDGSNVIAAGGSADDAPLLYTSPDGVTWTARTSPAGWWLGAASSGSVSVLVGRGPTYYAASSTDGVAWTGRSLAAGHGEAAWVGSQFVAVGANVASTSPDGVTWTARTIPAGTYKGIASGGSGSVPFAAGEYAITGTPTGSTFTYAETGADGTLVQAQTAEPLSGAATDTVPDGFLGAYLYTNENTGSGIGNANDRPPLSKDVAAFRDTLFFLNFTSSAYGTAYLLSVGGTNGLQSGDTVTINGLAYTAGAAENIGTRTFKITTTGSVSSNITATAQSLIRVVNRSLSSGVTLLDVSDPSGVPGQIGFRSSDSVSTLTVTFSRSTAWSPAAGITKTPTVHKNGLAYSKPSEPDHVPLALTQLPVNVGSQDKAGLRLTPIRDSVLLWKEDGLWKVSGTAGNWSVDPLDPTVVLIAPETARALNGSVYALTNQGVVRANESGVEIVSRAIEPVLLPLIAPAMKATTASLARAVAYESDRKFILWLPTSSSDTECTQAYVYDVITNAWTKRTDPAADAIVNPADDRLYKVTAGKVRRERKTLTAADYQEDTGTAFQVVVQPVPKFGGNPGALHAFQEAVWMFKSVQFTTATASFSTNITPAWGDVSLAGSDYGCSASAAPNVNVRVPVPQEHSRGSQIASKWTQSKAGGDFQLQGHSLNFRTCSTRVSR